MGKTGCFQSMNKKATSHQFPVTSKKKYKKLKVWQESHRLVLEIYKITKSFPKEELYGLISQMRRAAISVAANIVEGQSRYGRKEFLKFLYIASASLAELEYYFDLTLDLGYINRETFDKIDNQRLLVGKLLQGLILSLKRSSGN